MSGRPSWRARLAGVPWLLVLALLLPMVVAAGLWVWQTRELRSWEQERAEDRAVVNAATSLTLAWAAVDHREVDEYVERVQQGATGAFLQQFEQFEPLLRETLAENRSVQVPTIPKDGAALLERRGDEARVIVALDAAVSNKRTDGPRAQQFRLQVTLQKVDDRWLVSGLEYIDAAA